MSTNYDAKLSDLKGKAIKKIDGLESESEEIEIFNSDGFEYVFLRWCRESNGESNGYYFESVDFKSIDDNETS